MRRKEGFRAQRKTSWRVFSIIFCKLQFVVAMILEHFKTFLGTESEWSVNSKIDPYPVSRFPTAMKMKPILDIIIKLWTVINDDLARTLSETCLLQACVSDDWKQCATSLNLILALIASKTSKRYSFLWDPICRSNPKKKKTKRQRRMVHLFGVMCPNVSSLFGGTDATLAASAHAAIKLKSN